MLLKMVYKRYIKKGKKVYGPYSYKSIKKDGKVISEYLGKRGSVNKKREKSFKKYVFAGLAVLIVILSLTFINLNMTGKAVLSIEDNYKPGEQITGNVKLNLMQGELIPASTKIIINNAGEQSEFLLSELISENLTEGDFYIEDKDIFGTGDGYGFPGEKIIYPEVSFTMRVFEKETKKAKEKFEKIKGEEEINESELQEAIEETKLVEKSSGPVELSPITGGIISKANLEVGGVVSKNSSWTYELSEGETAEIISSSENVVLKIKKEIVTITTDYSETEHGFGKDYLTNKKIGIKIGLSKLNLNAKEGELVISLVYEGDEIVSISEKISEEIESSEDSQGGHKNVQESTQKGHKNLPDDSGEPSPRDDSAEPNKTEVIPEINITKQNMTIVNETIINVGGVNVSINTTQYSVIINKPVKWKKEIKLDRAINFSVEIHKEAENIVVYKIVDEEIKLEMSEDLNKSSGEELEKLNEDEILEADKITEVSGSPRDDSGEPSSKDTASQMLPAQEPAETGDPAGPKNKSKIKINTKIITRQVSAEIGSDKKGFSIAKFFKKLFGTLTGKTIEVEEKEEIKEVIIDFSDDLYGASTEYVIEYETPGPVAIESPPGDDSGEPNISNEKRIVISSDIYYKNILAYTELPREFFESSVQLYHLVNGTRIKVKFQGYNLKEEIKEAVQENISEKNKENISDEVAFFTEVKNTTGSNTPKESINKMEPNLNVSANNTMEGASTTDIQNSSGKLINYIEWVVPHLGNQTFPHLGNQTYELEIIILNVQSYPTVGGNWTVRFNTTGAANLTITAINGTTYGFDYFNDGIVYDLEFLELKCGNETLNVSVIIDGAEIPYDIYLKKKRIEEIRRELG